jgi:serine/threonine-protein kinase
MHISDDPDDNPPAEEPTNDPPLRPSGLGSGLLAQQPTPDSGDAVAVARVCPQCGGEYETGDRFCPKDGSPLRPKAGGDPLVGRVIADRYLILAPLGEGGMGRVYLGEHVKMNRQCAIKVMNPSLIHDHESLQRFAREASSAARILHPNVAAVFDYGEADKIVYLVMEFVDGEPLSTILARDGALDPRRAIDIARQIADGLHAAHELGIVHRDLKPDNVIVARNKQGREIPKVVDFGIAKALTDAPQDALTRSGLVIGTPEYMSPEQLLGDPVDARADIYSLGCILYQMLTGEAAFAAESREQMIRRRLHEAPPHVRDLLPDLPRRLDTLIVHMLARSPKDRLASAAEARDALDPSLMLGGWDPGSISSPGPAANLDASLRPTIPMPRVRTSPKRIAIGTAVGSALLLGGMAWWNNAQKAEVKQLTSAAPTVGAPKAAAVTADSVKKLPPLAKPNPDSGKKAAPVNEFDPPLNNLVRTIRSRDVGIVSRAFPGILPEDQKEFERMFANASSVSATLEPGTTVITGNDATRPFKLRYRVTDKNGQTTVIRPVSFKAFYRKLDSGWQLTRIVRTLENS